MNGLTFAAAMAVGLCLLLASCREVVPSQQAARMILNGNDEELQNLLDQRPELATQREKNGWTLLHFACEQGQVGCAAVLLDAGADVNAELAMGTTPLILAAESNAPRLVALLLRRGATLDATADWGYTALHMVALFSEPSVAKELLDAGCPLDNRTTGGYTPLHLAVSQNNIPMVKFLLNAGANPNTQSSLGYTALSSAVTAGSVTSVRLLFAHGARPGNGKKPVWGSADDPAFRELVRLVQEEQTRSGEKESVTPDVQMLKLPQKEEDGALRSPSGAGQ